MAKRVLQIIDTPYRCTIEEQDDPAIWITGAMRGAGGEFGLLLRGSAVNYAAKGQDASGLQFGDRRQTQPPRIENDLARLMEKDVPVFVVQEDAEERGLAASDLIPGARLTPRSGLARLLGEFDAVWHW
ncbi:MAG TPA: DsrE family protein [Candidatus Eisenbacteria bacterium]|nr:DsrE family protein [Candidatus Eisenbacteria bacterium]